MGKCECGLCIKCRFSSSVIMVLRFCRSVRKDARALCFPQGYVYVQGREKPCQERDD